MESELVEKGRLVEHRAAVGIDQLPITMISRKVVVTDVDFDHPTLYKPTAVCTADAIAGLNEYQP